jgi:hypothetical protein
MYIKCTHALRHAQSQAVSALTMKTTALLLARALADSDIEASQARHREVLAKLDEAQLMKPKMRAMMKDAGF